LARQQQVFTDQTLDNALLPQGAVATATDRLREVVGQGLAEFLTAIDQIDTSVQTAVYSVRELGLVDDPGRAAYYRTGVHSGLVINGVRIEPLAGWQRHAEGVLTKTLAQARREHR